MALLEIKELRKVYTSRLGNIKFKALDQISFSVESGEFVAIMGESGSGKTTLLNIISTIDQATHGEVYLEGKDTSNLNQSQLAEFRRENLGFVFQDFNLLDTMTVKNNILLPLVLSETPHQTMIKRLNKICHLLNINDLMEKYPYELSGGQKQRTAIARALITEPRLILADEPTGALDSKSAAALLETFAMINKNGQTILMVTHSIQAASVANRVLFIKDGKVLHQLYRGSRQHREFHNVILQFLAGSL